MTPNDTITQPGLIKKEKLSYDSYLRIPQLLEHQIPQSSPAHHDEYLFIVIHQTYELWFKLIIMELEKTMGLMRKKEILSAHHFLDRSVKIMAHLVKQIHLLQTMRPVDFLQFRDDVGPSSGFQSIQYREIEFMVGLKDKRYFKYFQDRPELLAVLEKRFEEEDLRSVFYKMLGETGFSIPPLPKPGDENEPNELQEALISELKTVFEKPEDHLPLYLLIQSILELDQNLMFWRQHHVRVVERIIGRKMGTGGSDGVKYLNSTLEKRSFPLLWEVASRLSK